MRRQPVESPLQRGGTEIPFERALLRCQDRSLDQNSVLSNMEPQEIPVGSELCVVNVKCIAQYRNSLFYPFLTSRNSSGIVSFRTSTTTLSLVRNFETAIRIASGMKNQSIDSE
jgi:hypothetical protein